MRLAKHVAHGSHVGQVRSLNEDYHRVWQFPLYGGELTLFAVADGMGGAAAGEVASKLAIEVLDESFSRYVDAMRQGRPVIGVGKLMDKAFRLANRRVYAHAIANAGQRGMGTTLTSAAVLQGRAYLAHVGDSRAYLARGKRIYQLTKDHSWVEEQLERGLITEEEARYHELRNLITRALGTRQQVAPDLIELEVEEGDVLVLSTDGLHSLVEPEEILHELKRNASRSGCVDFLIELANKRGGPDNITLIIAEIG